MKVEHYNDGNFAGIRTIQEYVAGFRFSENKDRVLLIEKNRPDWQAGKHNAIGGKIEEGETSIQAMMREFEEETGLQTTAEEWTHFVTLSGNGWTVDFYKSFSEDIYDSKQMTDEKPWIVYIEDKHVHEFCKIIPNLSWLVPLALDESIKNVVNVSEV